jgi:hypothetical protein
MVRSGGLFLLIVGAGIVTGGVLPRLWMVPVFLVGFASGFIALGTFGRVLRRGLGPVTRLQIAAIPAAILLQVLLIRAALQVFPDHDSRSFVLAILLAVGIHFLPFALAFGRLSALVAILCCANAMLGFLAPSIPLEVLWVIDGLVKMGCGVAMLRAPAAFLRATRAVG